MKPGDLVRTVRGKTGLIVGFPDEQRKFHPHYRLWDVMVDGNMKRIQGMNLEVTSEAR